MQIFFHLLLMNNVKEWKEIILVSSPSELKELIAKGCDIYSHAAKQNVTPPHIHSFCFYFEGNI